MYFTESRLWWTDNRGPVSAVLGAVLAVAFAAPAVGTASAALAAARTAPARSGLDWQPCSKAKFGRWKRVDGASLQGFDCAVFTRPLARNRPDGAKVLLATVRLPATGTPDQRKGTLFMNPGGPGQSGVGLSEIVFLLPAEIRQSFDFVTWDPRGIGASMPAISGPGCNIPKPSRPATGAVGWQRVLDRRIDQVDRANARCFRRNRAMIENGGTLDNAYDLEALRKAVGDPKLTYWGISYGTLLGSTYAQLFPGKVRAVVFDGNIDPQITLRGINAGSVAPDHSIGFFLEANPDLVPKYHAVIRRLDKHTLALPDGKRYTRWDVLDVLNDDVPFFINPEGDWTEARSVIETSSMALFGRGAAKRRARKALTNPDLQSPKTGTVGSLWSAVVCQDFADRLTHAQQSQGVAWAVREGPIYGGSLGVDYLTTCNGYNAAKPHPVPRPAKYGPDIPGIVSNATRDGETPYQWAVNMARTYRMPMLTLVGGIHGTFGLSESDCVDSTIAGFLVSGEPPATDMACPFSPPRSTSGPG